MKFVGHQECALLHLEGPGHLSKCRQSHFRLGRKVVQSSSRRFTLNWTSASSLIILSVCRSGWLRWVIPRPTIFLTCFMYSCSTQRSEIVPLHSRALQAEALCGSCYLGLLYPPWFDPRGCGRTDSGYQTGHWNHFALTVDAPPGDDHFGRRDIMA